MKRDTVRLAAALVMGFLLGSLFGAHSVLGRMVRRWNPEATQRHLLKTYTSRLDLTPDQREAVGGILESRRPELEALFAEMQKGYAGIRSRTRSDIAALLTPDQLARLRKLEARSEKRYRTRSIFGPPKQ